MGFCPANKRKKKVTPFQPAPSPRYSPGETYIPFDRIRTIHDDISWVYRIDRLREGVTEEVARVYGWDQANECANDLPRQKGDRIFIVPAYKVL